MVWKGLEKRIYLNILLELLFYTAWKVFRYGVFSGPYSVRMRRNTDQKKLRISTLHTDLFIFIAILW